MAMSPKLLRPRATARYPVTGLAVSYAGTGQLSLARTFSWQHATSGPQAASYEVIDVVGRLTISSSNVGYTTTYGTYAIRFPPLYGQQSNLTVRSLSSSGAVLGVASLAYTTPSAPGRPQSLAISSPSAGQIAASWQTPSSDGGLPILGYSIAAVLGDPDVLGYLPAVFSGQWVNVSQSLSGTISGLSTGTYTLYVVARNALFSASFQWVDAYSVITITGAQSSLWKSETLRPSYHWSI